MSQPRLLFVDDEPTILMTLSTILRRSGFEVTAAATVPEALDLIGKNQYDVLLSDLNIGEPGDGFTVVSAMRRLQPTAATFILTGYPDFASALLAIRNQVDDYFTKPADPLTLIATIQKQLSEPKPEPLPRRLRRVSDVLRENMAGICDQWLEAVEANADLSRIHLTREERSDHVPAVLGALVSRVEGDGEGTVEAAEKHGQVRCRQGYSIPQVVLEARLLQRAITSTVQTHLLGVDLSTLIGDLVEIGEGLATFLEISVRAYEAQCFSPAGT
jgi:YesN/AraC family two-component response regulator